MANDSVVWTATAVKQRREILKYWIRKNRSTTYAERLIILIDRRVRTILKSPESWKIVSKTDSRISAMGHYSILYKISDRGIIITSFWDNRQDPKKILETLTDK